VIKIVPISRSTISKHIQNLNTKNTLDPYKV